MTKTMAILATKTVENGEICLGASSASNYVPLTDGLTAEEAQTVRIARLDDGAFIGEKSDGQPRKAVDGLRRRQRQFQSRESNPVVDDAFVVWKLWEQQF